MRQSVYEEKSQLLQQLMQQAGISSLQELSKIARVSELQLIKLQYGLLPKLPLEFTLKVAPALQISVDKFIEIFTSTLIGSVKKPKENDSANALESLRQEYQLLQQQFDQQKDNLHQEFQQESLQALESWLLQWPTAVAIIQKNPQLPAERILPLIKPIEQLLQKWGLEAIAQVGENVAYDPRRHELIKGTAEIGELVKVRYVGYRQGDRLLYRAKVSSLE